MILEGEHSGVCNGLCLKRPVYPYGESIIVFDLDGVLIKQVERYENGRRVSDGYRMHGQAREVVKRAVYDFRKVVLWSAISDCFNRLEGFPFSETHLRIRGVYSSDDGGIKNLRMLSANMRKVAALEDFDGESGAFEPADRVVRVREGDSLMDRYFEARDLVI